MSLTMNFSRVIFFFFFSCFVGSVAATTITPESGWWWNPNESGRGYSIEIQDNFIFMAAYTYEAEESNEGRKPTWFTAVGKLIGDDTFVGDLLVTNGGQCFGCEYSAPTSAFAHSVSISFSSRTEAELTVDGETTQIQRFKFAPSFYSPEQKLLGQWTIISDVPQGVTVFKENVLGEILVFDEIVIDGDKTYIYGCRAERTTQAYCSETNKTNDLAIALYDKESQQYGVAVNQSGFDYRGYWLTLDSNVGRGWVDQYLKRSGVFDWDAAVWFRAYRSASKSFIDGEGGPAKSTVGSKVETNYSLESIEKSTFSAEPSYLSETEIRHQQAQDMQRLQELLKRGR